MQGSQGLQPHSSTHKICQSIAHFQEEAEAMGLWQHTKLDSFSNLTIVRVYLYSSTIFLYCTTSEKCGGLEPATCRSVFLAGA